MIDHEQEVERLLIQADDQLHGEHSQPFSPQAFQLLKQRISSYIRLLVLESYKNSRRHRVDTISSTHVEQANDYLVTNTASRGMRLFGIVGGILLGASVSSFLTMTTSNQYTTAGVLISTAFAVLGVFGITYHMVKE